MSSLPKLGKWECAERQRSATEASHTDLTQLVADEREVTRYLDPPADTCYPLEYSFYLVGDVQGQTVLEYGCGDGLNTLSLARRGANVKALDISPELINIAYQRLIANRISSNVEFIVGSAHDVPFADNSIDIVFGMQILHHLDLSLSKREVQRVLRKGGRAIFQEPVRNSRLIKALRSLIPYKAPDISPYERPLTDKELAQYAEGFSSCQSKAFLLPTTSLVDIVPPLRKRFIHQSHKLDAAILRKFPSLAWYSPIRVIELIK